MPGKLTTNYLPEFAALFLGRSKPAVVTVNITNQCNQNCLYCEIGQNHLPKGKEALSFNDMIWIIDEMFKNNIRKIALCGGEPFLFEGILELINYAWKKNIRSTITTNGMTVHMLNDSELKVLKDCKAQINISIDSFNNKTQSITRGTPVSLPNALKSIQKLSDSGIPLTVLAAISKYNYHDLFNFIISAYKKNIKQVLFQPIIFYSNYPDLTPINEKSKINVSSENISVLKSELREILNFEKSHHISTNVYRILPWIEYYLKSAETQDGEWFFNNVLKKFYCREIYAIIDISYDGGIQPCGLSPAKITIYKNRQKGLINLWSEATKDIKNDLSNNKYHPYCNGCCHHFSRNMLASIIKHPIKNRTALAGVISLIISRIISMILKKTIYSR